jgi:amidohydrolase
MEATFMNQLVQFRQELHQHPEVSQKEFQTQQRIIQKLTELGVEQIVPVGITGVMALFDGKAPGKTVLLRADTDALPIQELNDFAHKSIFEGVSHKCGHDGHSTIMIGVAEHLVNNPLANGKVILLWQPAEENGEGAKAVLADPNFPFAPDWVFALHNLPGYPLHQVVVREGSFTAAAKSIILKLNGKTSHAAEPELGTNPALAIGELIKLFDEIKESDLSKKDFALTTPVHINMGEKAYGVSAGYGEVHYTLRTWDNLTMEAMCEKIMMDADKIARKYHLELVIDWTESFFANQNDPVAVSMTKVACQELDLPCEERATPFKWGEDFGLFTEKYRGAMFGIGSGENHPALHNPDYDFPDEIIPTGVGVFLSLINQSLK